MNVSAVLPESALAGNVKLANLDLVGGLIILDLDVLQVVLHVVLLDLLRRNFLIDLDLLRRSSPIPHLRLRSMVGRETLVVDVGEGVIPKALEPRTRLTNGLKKVSVPPTEHFLSFFPISVACASIVCSTSALAYLKISNVFFVASIGRLGLAQPPSSDLSVLDGVHRRVPVPCPRTPDDGPWGP